VWSDLLTSLERASDHCSNIAGCVMEEHQDMNLHESLRDFRAESKKFQKYYKEDRRKYTLPQNID
jgi:phosphate:Na+ symporter